MELNDNEFDAAFRKKVSDAEPQFEEAAWDKMERKLRKRDRVVFIRKASAALAVLLLLGTAAYYSFNQNPVKTTGTGIAKKQQPVKTGAGNEQPGETGTGNEPGKQITGKDRVPANEQLAQTPAHGQGKTAQQDSTGVSGAQRKAQQQVQQFAGLNETSRKNMPAGYENAGQHTLSAGAKTDYKLTNGVLAMNSKTTLAPLPEPAILVAATAVKDQENAGKKPVTAKIRRKIPFSLALTVGPEFNSDAALVGGKAGFSGGLIVSAGLTRRLSVQAGLKYSAKDYATDGNAYHFKTPNIKNLVDNIDASCAVLEIPIQASYTVMEDKLRSIDINAGLSSYLMLKEDYRLRYLPQAGLPDRVWEKVNANQHYLSVVDLSATYYIKLKQQRFKIGVEPYVKIPLTGIGEGSVNLKSSGISFKVRYDLDKKNK